MRAVLLLLAVLATDVWSQCCLCGSTTSTSTSTSTLATTTSTSTSTSLATTTSTSTSTSLATTTSTSLATTTSTSTSTTTTTLSVQVLSAGGSAAQSNSATNYLPIMGTSAWSATQAREEAIIATGGTLGGLRALVQTVPGGTGSWAVTVMLNDSPTSLTCTITSAITTCQDATNAHNVTVAAGDRVAFRSVPANTPNTPTSANLLLSVLWQPTTVDETVMSSTNSSVTFTNADRYAIPMQGNSGTADTNARLVMPIAGTIKKLYSWCTSTAAASTRVWTLNLNGTPQALTCTQTGTANTCNNTSDTVAVVAGDSVNFFYTFTGTPTAQGCAVGAVFVPTTSGRYLLGGFAGSSTPTTGTDVFGSPAAQSIALTATEDAIIQRIAQASTIKNLYVLLNAANGGTLTMTLNKAAATPTALTCDSVGATGCTAAIDAAVANDDLLTTSYHHTGTAGVARSTQTSYSAVFTGSFP